MGAALANRTALTVWSGGNRLWIVCPLNAMPAWHRAKPLFATLFKEVIIISQDSLHKLEKGITNIGGVLIVDEAHGFGSAKARRTKAAHAIRSKFDACFCLTGTFLHGGIEKALSIQDLAVPGLARFASRWTCGEYFKCLVQVVVGGRTVTELKKPIGIAKECFKAYLARGCVFMNKDTKIVRKTLDVPDQDIHTIEVGMCDLNIDQLATLCALRLLDETGEMPHAQAVAHALCQEGIEAKIEWIVDNADDESEQVVIFAQYTESLDLMEAACQEQGWSYVRVDGKVTGYDRADAERRFRSGEARFFIGQQHASSVSMNLQNANVSIALDHNWMPTDYDQMLARTCRRGQTRACYHFDLVANKMQKIVINRLSQGMSFDAECSEYQEVKLAILTPLTGSPE